MTRRLSVWPTFLILGSLDAILVALAFVAAYFLRLRTDYPPPVEIPPLSNYYGMMAIQVITLVIAFGFYRLYVPRRGVSRLDEWSTVFVASSIGTIAATAFTSFIFKGLDYPRLMVAYVWILTILLVGLGRYIVRSVQFWLHQQGFGQERVIIVGAGRVGRTIAQIMKDARHLGYDLVGFIDNDPNLPDQVDGIPILGNLDALANAVRQHGVGEVIIALPYALHQEILEIVGRCEGARVNVKVFPDLLQLMASEVGIADLNGFPLLSIRDVALRGWRLTLKRIMDVVISGVILILISPLLLLIAILIKRDSPGPVFFIQERVGLDARPFPVIKFRTMCVNAEDMGTWTTANDPRRTRLGAFLRRYSLDELPQFINVLLGDMSIVGPRPEQPAYVEQFRKLYPRYMERHREKAGITGWAAVNGLRGDSSIEERTRYDLWYVENWSLWLDIKIILRTPGAMLKGKNAY